MKFIPGCLKKHRRTQNRMPGAYTSDGHILPCCQLDHPKHEKDVRAAGLRDEELKLENNESVTDIIASDQWNNFFDTLQNDPENAPAICKKYCTIEENSGIVEMTTDYVKESKKDWINIDTSHRCELRCPMCIRQRAEGPSIIKRSKDITLENLNKILEHYNIGVNLCGQISDPIYHPRFHEILDTILENGNLVTIATCGSNKPEEFWDEAYSKGKDRVQWKFGVDGIDEKSEIYRVGSNFESAWNAMIKGRDLGHYIVWQYIIFGYNEHEINEAKLIAAQEGFSIRILKSNRSWDSSEGVRRKNVDLEKLQMPKKKNRVKGGPTSEQKIMYCHTM
jgi:organic radical activating enzyme